MKEKIIIFIFFVISLLLLVFEKPFIVREDIVFFLSLTGLVFIIIASYGKLINIPFKESVNLKKDNFFEFLLTFMYIIGLAVSSVKIYFILFLNIIFWIYCILKKRKKENKNIVLENEEHVINTEKISEYVLESVIFFILFIFIGVLNFF